MSGYADLPSPLSRRTSLSAYGHREIRTYVENAREPQPPRGMARQRGHDGEDLFLELAHDHNQSSADDVRRPLSRSELVKSRLSDNGHRRSTPAEPVLSSSERRPKSSGVIFNRPPSRLGALQYDLHRHVDRYRSLSTAADTVSVAGSGRAYRYTNFPERSSMSPSSRLAERIRSPELPSYGRRRPSFGSTPPQALKDRQGQIPSKAPESPDESPADSSDPKRSLPDSASADSQTADTVWDELDDLKSRIKKLELTGKLPSNTGAATSGQSGERPRTATTAPTTIGSSPKYERKPEVGSKGQQVTEDNTSRPNVANIHPLLHSALANAKPLLNTAMYRTLEATASDALQLAAMTGSAGPQGTAFSAASIINGVTVADRHVRRKADNMCRNLTDLCIALCEGKNEVPSVIASPITIASAKASPTYHHSRSSIGSIDGGQKISNRPMSRLEARRSSMLGLQHAGSVPDSPREKPEDISASEHETTPSQPGDQPREFRRTSRVSSRLLHVRKSRHDDDGGTSGDENLTARPPSRAMTDIGARAKHSGLIRDYASSGQQRSPSLREALVARRVSGAAYEGNRETSRTSLPPSSGESVHRRYADQSTPSVREEEGDGGTDRQSLGIAQPKRRITSLGQFTSRRATGEVPDRAASLSQRRHVVGD